MNKFIEVLQNERKNKYNNGLYHKLQIDFSYNTNRIEGSTISHDQTRYIFETKTISMLEKDILAVKVDDIIETRNHFRCFDFILDTYKELITPEYIKELHKLLKNGIFESGDYVSIGEYKTHTNEVGIKATAPPGEVPYLISELLNTYNSSMSLYDIAGFHAAFEAIHPFYDGNGRVGRLLMFKQCLVNKILPFFIEDSKKMFYYKGLDEWCSTNEDERLITCFLDAQDTMEHILKYFSVPYNRSEYTYKQVIMHKSVKTKLKLSWDK